MNSALHIPGDSLRSEAAAHVKYSQSRVILRDRNIEIWLRIFEEHPVFPRGSHANHFHPRAAFASFLEPAADRVLTWPQEIREAAVHDRHARRVIRIRLRKAAAGLDTNRQGGEVMCVDDVLADTKLLRWFDRSILGLNASSEVHIAERH